MESTAKKKLIGSALKEVNEYCLTEEGKGYLHEYQDMKWQQHYTSVIAILAFFVSAISLVCSLMGIID